MNDSQKLDILLEKMDRMCKAYLVVRALHFFWRYNLPLLLIYYNHE